MEIGPIIEVNPTILFKTPCRIPWSFSDVWFDINAFKVGLTISDKAATGIMTKTRISTRMRPNETSATIPQVKEKSVKFFVESLSKNFNRITNAWTIKSKKP